MLATIKSGPSGARSGSQTYWPGFRVTVSGETRTPSVKVSASTKARSRANKAATVTSNENKDFMAVNVQVKVRVMPQAALDCQSFLMRINRTCRARQPIRSVLLDYFLAD